MRLEAIVYMAEEGGFWTEVPGLPGCATQGDSFDERIANLIEAIAGCLSAENPPPPSP